MSDERAYEPTTRLPQGGGTAPDRAQPDRTQVMPRGAAPADRVAYTEDYSAERHPGDDVGGVAGPGRLEDRLPDPHHDERRSFGLPAMAIAAVVALLVGAILTLLLLPEEDPQVVLADQAAQAALAASQQAQADQAARIAELEGVVAERDARVAELEARVAELEAQLASAQAAQAGDQAAADQAAAQAAADREAALDQREQALDERDAAVAAREQAVAEREQAVAEREATADQAPGDGFELPEVPDLEIPGELPQIDEDEARGIVERFIDRIQSFFG
jgi:hypothetical protein